MSCLGSIPIDDGADILMRRINQNSVGASFMITNGTHDFASQNVIAPTAAAGWVSSMFSSEPQKPTMVMSASHITTLRAMITDRATVATMLGSGFTFKSVLGCNLNLEDWLENGYTLADAIEMQATWEELQRFGVGSTFPSKCDYGSLFKPPLSITFSDIFHCPGIDGQWKKLATLTRDARTLKRIQFSFKAARDLLIKNEDWLLFRHITLTQFHDLFELDRKAFMDWSPPESLVDEMGWNRKEILELFQVSITKKSTSLPGSLDTKTSKTRAIGGSKHTDNSKLIKSTASSRSAQPVGRSSRR